MSLDHVRLLWAHDPWAEMTFQGETCFDGRENWGCCWLGQILSQSGSGTSGPVLCEGFKWVTEPVSVGSVTDAQRWALLLQYQLKLRITGRGKSSTVLPAPSRASSSLWASAVSLGLLEARCLNPGWASCVSPLEGGSASGARPRGTVLELC